METAQSISFDFRSEDQTEMRQQVAHLSVRKESVQEEQLLVGKIQEDGNERKKKAIQGPEPLQKPFNTEIKSSQDTTKRKGSDSSDKSEHESTNISTNSDGTKQTIAGKKATAVAFLIPVEQNRVCRPPPKRFCNQEKSERENISMERLKAKQEMAERRKKQHEERRLKRIHDRQEAARKLAHNVEILLHQRSIVNGERNVNPHAPQLSSAELLTTAHHVARDFKTLTCQMSKDFTMDDKNNNSPGKCPSQAKTNQPKEKRSLAQKPRHNQHHNNDSSNKSVAFTVGFDDEEQQKSPVPKSLLGPQKKERGKLTAKELEEKQRKAEERRITRQQERVQRVKANREALMKLASDLETFMIWNDTEQSASTANQDNDNLLDQQDAAKLAKEIADGFDRMSQRYSRDLQQAEGFSTCSWWGQKPLQK